MGKFAKDFQGQECSCPHGGTIERLKMVAVPRPPREAIETAHFHSHKEYVSSCFWDSVLLGSIFNKTAKQAKFIF